MKKSELRQIIREEIGKMNSNWWDEMSPEEKREYVKQHPNTSKGNNTSTKTTSNDDKWKEAVRKHKMFEDDKITMNNLDWGKTTAERNKNLDIYNSLKSKDAKELFLKKLKQPTQTKQITVTERNAQEGETFSYIINVDNDILSKIKKGLKSRPNIKIEEDTNYTKSSIIKLNKESHNRYMERYQFYDIILPKGRIDWYSDVFYKAVGLKPIS